MATVVKNFRIKSGLIVEGTTGTINGQNILRETGSDSYILNLVGGATLVKSVEATQLEVNGAGKLSVKSGVFEAAGAAAAAKTAAEATASADATSKANAAASSAISAAATDATSKANAAQAAAISAAATDATTKANAAKSAAEATAAAALSAAISTEVTNRNTAISTAVDSLVDGAPALLNTLNELAAAINDDANYTTTLTSALATKANSSDVTTAIATAKSEATAAASADATSKANAAQSAASADATSKANAAQSAAEATAAAANAAQQAGTTAFTALNVNDQAKQIAASSSGTASVAGTAYQWAKADYRSAKLLVKIDNASHNEISEILLTLDASDNVAITEYAIVGTNGSRGTITAEVSGSNVLVKVTPTDNSTIKVSGTLLK